MSITTTVNTPKDARNNFETLRASQDFIDLLLATMPSPAIVVTPDRKIVLANHAFLHATGIGRKDVLGKRAGKIFGCSTPNQSCDSCVDAVGHGVCSSALLAFQSEQPVQTLTQFDIESDGRAGQVDGILTTKTFRFHDQTLALVIFPECAPLLTVRPPERFDEGMHGIVGSHPSMLNLYESIRRVGPTKLPVLIQGESGTGKEMIAIALHRESMRGAKALVCVNSGALPEGVLESELFGHVRGAFTGAIRDKRGRFEIANNGTLFLDEIGDLPPPMQVKLLRVLQEGTFERVGGEQTVKVDVRLICATNRDLEEDVANGRFRADLFYRISAVPVTAPPLRSHKSDIPLLVRRILNCYAKESERDATEIATETMDILVRYDWPGNVRELENALHFGIVYASGGILLPRHLPARIVTEVAGAAVKTRRLDQERVRNALKATDGNKRRAAQLLGVSRATLYRFLGEIEEASPGSQSERVSSSRLGRG